MCGKEHRIRWSDLDSPPSSTPACWDPGKIIPPACDQVIQRQPSHPPDVHHNHLGNEKKNGVGPRH